MKQSDLLLIFLAIYSLVAVVFFLFMPRIATKLAPRVIAYKVLKTRKGCQK